MNPNSRHYGGWTPPPSPPKQETVEEVGHRLLLAKVRDAKDLLIGINPRLLVGGESDVYYRDTAQVLRDAARLADAMAKLIEATDFITRDE